MKARTLSNEAALLHEADFINGVVNQFMNRRGFRMMKDVWFVVMESVANEVEVVSCTEEGAWPIASIVTTTVRQAP